MEAGWCRDRGGQWDKRLFARGSEDGNSELEIGQMSVVTFELSGIDCFQAKTWQSRTCLHVHLSYLDKPQKSRRRSRRHTSVLGGFCPSSTWTASMPTVVVAAALSTPTNLFPNQFNPCFLDGLLSSTSPHVPSSPAGPPSTAAGPCSWPCPAS
jgi:hypothetical protein